MNASLSLKFAILSAGALLLAAPAAAQGPYAAADRPVTVGAADAPSVRVMRHRSTELGDALDGLSLVIEAQGRRERHRSEALVNLQQAERLRLQNLVERERAKLAVERERLELAAVKAQRQQLLRQLSLERQARMKPAVVVSRKGTIQWIDPLRAERFAAHRQTLEKQVQQVTSATSLEQRERGLEDLNFSCQELLEALEAEKGGMSASAWESSRRFVIRLYDDLQQPVTLVAAPTLTGR